MWLATAVCVSFLLLVWLAFSSMDRVPIRVLSCGFLHASVFYRRWWVGGTCWFLNFHGCCVIQALLFVLKVGFESGRVSRWVNQLLLSAWWEPSSRHIRREWLSRGVFGLRPVEYPRACVLLCRWALRGQPSAHQTCLSC